MGMSIMSRVEQLFINEDFTVDHDRLSGLVDHPGAHQSRRCAGKGDG